MAPGKVNEVKCEGIFQDCTMYRFGIGVAACPCSAVRLQDAQCQVRQMNFNLLKRFEMKRMGRPSRDRPADETEWILSPFVSHCKRKEPLCGLKKPPLSLFSSPVHARQRLTCETEIAEVAEG